MSFSDLRLARAHGEPPGGWRVCRVPPPAPQACAALGWAPTMMSGRARIGRLLAGVCRARLGRPIDFPARHTLGRPMPPLLQRGFDSLEDANTANPTTLANGVEGVKLMDVKDSEKRADRPPKSLGGGPRVFWGRVSPGPRQLWGPRPGGL